MLSRSATGPAVSINKGYKMTRQEAIDTYSALDSSGRGFAVGNVDMTLTEAAIAEGWSVVERYDCGIVRAVTDSGDTILIGGDAYGRAPWAVRVI